MDETASAWSDADLAEVVGKELQLLDPSFRSQPAAVLDLLHPDFLEFGASGHRWDARSTAELLAQEAPRVARKATDLAPVRLANDVVLLTYTAHHGDKVSLRSSVWVRQPELGWVLRFHQGTPMASARPPL